MNLTKKLLKTLAKGNNRIIKVSFNNINVNIFIQIYKIQIQEQIQIHNEII